MASTRKPGLTLIVGMAKPSSPEDRRRQAADTEAEMTGRPLPFGGRYRDQADGFAREDEPSPHGSGTKGCGYLQPDQGPFRCDHCEFFKSAAGSGAAAPGADGDEMSGRCTNASVRADVEVRGQVRAGGCCNYFEREQSPAASAPAPAHREDEHGGTYQQATYTDPRGTLRAA